ncbi:MAG: gamma-glutamylcyclotransferase, partial [Euryarchaeota archaeon]|nr:gamma-glutamylcyclotransferase [Euryarchaeota archaeon]
GKKPGVKKVRGKTRRGMAAPVRPLLFAYGTLRPEADHPMARWLEARSDHLGPATCPGLLLDLGAYPGYIIGNGTVHGDLLRLRDEDDLVVLDDYEGVPDLFVRETRAVRGPDGKVEAIVYRHYGPAKGRKIANGDWLAHVARSG